jgi:hypothetical protein
LALSAGAAANTTAAKSAVIRREGAMIGNAITTERGVVGTAAATETVEEVRGKTV